MSTGQEHSKSPTSVTRETGKLPHRLAVAVVALLSVAASPILAVYELLAGVAVIVLASVLRRPGTRQTRRFGVALLAGPAAYMTAWLLVQLFR